MEFFKIISVGIIQAVTEFIPVSSSGHLNLFQYFFPISNILFIDIFFNTATLISVIIFLRKELPSIPKQLPYLIVSTLPLILLAIFFHNHIENSFHKFDLLPIFFLITSIFLFSTKFTPQKNYQINFKKALIIGLCQSIAIFPGVSRSALTISSALLLGLSAKNAFQYSFFLYIPVSIGALILSLLKYHTDFPINHSYYISFVVCVVVGILSLKILNHVLKNKNLWKFSVYTLLVSIVLLLSINL